MIRKMLMFILGFIITLFLSELYFQLSEIQTPMETRIDPKLGPTYIPNKKITRFNEGFFMGSINALGYMGPSVSFKRQQSEIRIILLGDSFVLGHTVFPRHHFSRSLEQYLREKLGKDVIILNFGKADFNLGNMFVYYRYYAAKFDHDLALFFLGKDDILTSDQVASNLYPNVILKDNKLVINNDFLLSSTYQFYKFIEPVLIHSSILRLLFNAYKNLNSLNWNNIIFKLSEGRQINKQENIVFLNNFKNEYDIPELSKAIISELSNDRRNILVIREEIPQEIHSEIIKMGIDIIDLASFLKKLKYEGIDPYYWPVTKVRGHWNHQSQPLIGRFIAEQIYRIKISPGQNWN